MRAILFKAKRVEDDKWVFGDLYRRTDVFGERQTIIFEDKGSAEFKINLVDPKTVSQYINWDDICGNPIFENDIVEGFINDEKYIGYIVFRQGSFFVQLNDEGCYGLALSNTCWEVIGNIYDHPEILKERI